MTIFLLKAAFVTCVLFVASTLGAQLWLDWRDQSANLPKSLFLFLLALVFLSEPLCAYVKGFTSSKIHRREQRANSLAANVVLGIFILFLVSFQLPSVGLLLAVVLDKVGSYELGEQVYAALVHDGDNSLASVLPRDSHDRKPLEAERLDKCVSKLYGPESIQMSRRFTVAGIHSQQRSDFHKAEEYYQKASTLYEKSGDKRWELSTLHFLAFVQYHNHAQKALEGTLTKACQAIPSGHLNAADSRDLEVLSSLAHTVGLPQQEAIFLQARTRAM